MSSPVLIRAATGADAAILADLGARTFHETFAADNTAEDMERYLEESFSVARLEEELRDAAATFLIAAVDGTPAGYAKLHAGPAESGVTGDNPIEIVRLYVLREWLGRAVGAALMRESIEEAQRRGHDVVWLGVWERNARAQAFYRKWDFREVGEHVFMLGSDAQRDILMARAVERSVA
jgi:ribosomal protein S18 acetylase RimI-like enzyme